MFYRKCEVKNLFACVFIYNQKGAMSDSIPYALLVYIGLIVFYLEAPVHVTYWFDRSLAMKSPSLNGMEFKHKIVYAQCFICISEICTLHDMTG